MPATFNFHHIVTRETLPRTLLCYYYTHIVYGFSGDIGRPLPAYWKKLINFFQINVGRLGLSEEKLVSRETNRNRFLIVLFIGNMCKFSGVINKFVIKMLLIVITFLIWKLDEVLIKIIGFIRMSSLKTYIYQLLVPISFWLSSLN